MPFIAPIVEGHGEVEAVPILLRRIARYVGITEPLRINPPIRVKSSAFLNTRDDRDFRRYVNAAALKAVQEKGKVLIVLDCDDSDTCPAKLGPSLLSRAKNVRSDVDYLVVLARREYESWFIAAAESLRGFCGLPLDLSTPMDTSGIRDAKGWLGKRMDAAHGPYDPITHQADFTRRFDLEQARSNDSFDRMLRRLTIFLR